MLRNFLIRSLLTVGLFASTWAYSVTDEVSYGNIRDVVSTHLHLELSVDFKAKQLTGYVEHQLNWQNKAANKLVLDTRDLTIEKVTFFSGDNWKQANFKLFPHDDVMGSKLSIDLAKQPEKVRIYYTTSPTASGLQWLTPVQTAGKKAPFMYSQSQAIHARSWIPVQDTPAMRVTYSAHIETPKNLLAVMSADNSKNLNKKDGDYQFQMPQAIPPYLIAIGVGDLAYQSMSSQTGVYAEPSILASAVAEFDDTQAMIEANEKLYDEYRWGQYDLLILPPAFPFGGMENPRLSFITPTVIAGDKSLVNLIAHELAHSWSGNLVTNATWRDLWLNEGFTSYLENRVMEEVFGEERAVMEQWLGVASLKSDLDELPKNDTILNLPLNGRDPDDAFSNVPYVKGQLFLMYLEEKFGREKFDAFVKQYFNHFAFQSLTTAQFEAYLNKHLIEKHPGVVSKEKVHEWIHKPGMPADAPDPQSDAFAKVKQKLDSWLSGELAIDELKKNDWSVHEWLYFLEQLPEDLSKQNMVLLDNTFGLTKSSNSEISFAWYMQAINSDYWVVEQPLESYLSSIGRRKFIVPLYKALANHSPERKKWAEQIYKKARSGYHPLAQGSIDEIFIK